MIQRFHRDLQDFLDRELYPAVFAGADQALPEFGWKRRNARWVATDTGYTRSLDGSPRPSRVELYENSKHGFTVHGFGFVRWIDHFGGGRAGIEELCRRAGLPSPFDGRSRVRLSWGRPAPSTRWPVVGGR